MKLISLALVALVSLFRGLGRSVHDRLFLFMAGQGLVLGANSFSKEERVAFDDMLLGFEDALVASNEVAVFRGASPQMMERTNNVIWRPQPYIMPSYDGLDQSANFGGTITQLSVPVTLGYSKSVPWSMTASELRDKLQNGQLYEAAKQRLTSDINVAVTNVACLQGTLVVKRGANTPTGYDDVAEADSLLTEQGVQINDRKIILQARHYNAMASNLAQRQTVHGKVQTAYERSYIGPVASFDAFKADYTYRLTAAAGVTVTINEATAANRRYVPKATSTAGTGETNNVDNRYMNITIGVSSGTVKIGDCFTIAGVNAVHHITKQDTGQLKTFRIVGIVSGSGGAGVVTISPPIIAADSSPTTAELQYKNVTATPANGAAITFLNTVSGNVAPFWVREAIELIPGTYAPQEDAGLSVLRGTTKQGIEVLLTKQATINDLTAKYRADVRFGVGPLQPQMMGIELFGQS